MVSRRTAVKGVVGAAALGVFLAGYWDTVDRIVKPSTMLYKPDKLTGAGVRYVYTSCLGCNVRCGIRVRVSTYDGLEVIDRVEGNPYHPYNRYVSADRQLNRYDALDYKTPVQQSLKFTGTLCARGQDGIHYVYDPYRIVKPLKRAGPRGSGKWKTISWQQLVKEVVEGGVIEETGERLPGLKELYVFGKLKEAGFENPGDVLASIKKDVDELMAKAADKNVKAEELESLLNSFKEKWSKTLGEKGLKLEDVLVDPDNPDLGTKANMLVYMRGRGQDNADVFTNRFVTAFGSVNWLRHTSSCQLGFYAGNYLWSGYYDINPDAFNANVLIMAGAAMGRIHPGATGQGLLVERAAEGKLKVYYVNPLSPRTAAKGNIVWVPIKPGTDAALALAMAQILIQNGWINKAFLEKPSKKAAETIGYPYQSNATWLVVMEEGHSLYGYVLTDKLAGLGEEGKPLVYTKEGLAVNDKVDSAELEYSGRVKLATGEEVLVKTAFTTFKETAFSKTVEQWAGICGVPVEMIKQMAKDFWEAAPKAATYIHRGVAQHPNGEYTVWALRSLDILIGNFHRAGGLLARPSTTSYNNYLYNCAASGFGEPLRWGPPIDRHRAEYEKTLLYYRKVKKGENPYPAKRPWYPLSPEESYTELFAGMDLAYPYPVKALILYFANPVISVNNGLKFAETLKDTRKLPLFIGITTTINETYLYADYIIPDTTYLETGTSGVQFLYSSGMGRLLAEAWRSPAIMPLTEKIADAPDGSPRYASMWEFFIDVGKALQAAGYGDKAIPGVKGRKYEGQWFPLHSFWDYIMRVYANGAVNAVDRGIAPKEIPAEDVRFVEENYPIARFKNKLPEGEWRAAAYCLARGGVFTRYEESFNELGFSKRSVPGTGVLQLWYETLAKTRNSITGKKFWGGPAYFETATYAPVGQTSKTIPFAGTPLREIYPESQYPLNLIFESGPFYTKHRGGNYYWIKTIMSENFVLVNKADAEALGVKTGDVVAVESPDGVFEAPAVVTAAVAKGVVAVPYGMGRWVETLVVKPGYVRLRRGGETLQALPEKVEIPEDAVNPVKQLPTLVKKMLFTNRPGEYFERGLAVDEWRFAGVTPNLVELSDQSLGGWPLLTWLGAGQSYYSNPVKISKTGKMKKLMPHQIVW
ncbi:MAG: molybdopterin-dependent oxidoreductase [Candidatus Caldarchaeum sp.]